MTLKENTLFDNRYKLLRRLGEGGYSEVWYVEDTFAKIELALKIFLPSAQLDERGIELFRNEFTVIYNLNHSNLLKCTYLGVADGCPYLVMPYYEGGSAENLVGKCDENTCWEFLHDVAAGLEHLHTQHPPIIHQDIKPDNILRDKEKFIITDFGISFNMKNALAGDVEEAVVKGTKPYMPPEKFQQDSAPLMAGDIWALGASAFELITGHLPFKNGGLDQQADTPIPSLPGQYSEELRALVTQCLNFHPWERPFARDMEQLTALKIQRKGKKTGEIELPPPPEKKRKGGLLVALVAAAVLGVLALVAVNLFRGKEPNPNEETPMAMSATTADTTVEAAQPNPSETEEQAVSRPAEPAALPAVKGKPVPSASATAKTSATNETKQPKAEQRSESQNSMMELSRKKKQTEQIQSTETEVEGLD